MKTIRQIGTIYTAAWWYQNKAFPRKADMAEEEAA
jgi:hypothetical protein